MPDDGPSATDGLHVSHERIAAAAALRRLGHALVARDIDDTVLRRIAERVEDLLTRIDDAPPRQRPIIAMKHDLFSGPPADDDTMDHSPDCIVSGAANPMGIGIRVARDDDEAVARVALGPAFEGAPGRAHGGVVAAIFDDTMGFVLSMLRTPAYTGRLTVTYRAPTPIGEELEFTAARPHRAQAGDRRPCRPRRDHRGTGRGPVRRRRPGALHGRPLITRTSQRSSSGSTCRRSGPSGRN